MKLNPNWRTDLAEGIAKILFGVIIFLAVGVICEITEPVVTAIASCPIHVTTSYGSDYCLHLGIGK